MPSMEAGYPSEIPRPMLSLCSRILFFVSTSAMITGNLIKSGMALQSPEALFRELQAI